MKTNLLKKILILFFILPIVFVSGQDTINVDLTTSYQTITGFGGKYIYNEASILINDLGLSIGRIPLNSGFQTSPTSGYSFSAGMDFESGVDMSEANITQFQALGMTSYYVTPFTPADFMKWVDNDACSGGTCTTWNRLSNGLGPESNLQDGFIGPDTGALPNYYPAYADYLVAFCKDFSQTFGFDVKYISMQNEPRFTEPYASCIFNPQQMRDLVRLVGPKLDSAGLTTKIMAAEDMGSYTIETPWIDTLLSDPICRKYIGVWAVHSYIDGVTPDLGSATGWSELVNTIHGYNLPLWMTETQFPSTNWSTGGFPTAQALYLALKFGQVNVWSTNCIVDPGWEGAECFISSNANGNVPTVDYYAAKQFYKYINPGAVQVASSSNSDLLVALTFRNPANLLFTMVILNLDTVSSHTAVFNLAGLPATMQGYETSYTQNFADLGLVNINSVTFSPGSVSTFIYQGTVAPPVIHPVHDTAILMSSTSNLITLTGISDGVNAFTVTATSDNDTLMANPVVSKINDSTYQLNLVPVKNQVGNVNIEVAVKTNSTSDVFSTSYQSFHVNVIPFVNKAPTINSIQAQNIDVVINHEYTISLSGITDGNNDNEAETVKIAIATSNSSITRSLKVNYTSGESTGTITFYALALGMSNITLTVQNSGSTDLGGKNTTIITFQLNLKTASELNESAGKQMSIYPNPSSDLINLILPDESYREVMIIDITGRVVLQQSVNSSSAIINVESLAKGVYIVIAKNDQDILQTKITKE